MSILTFLFIWWVIGIILIPLSEWKLNDWKKPSTLKTPGDWLCLAGIIRLLDYYSLRPISLSKV